MEEQIFDIIERNYNFFKGVNEAHIASSKELAAHFTEFIEWKDENADYHKGHDIYSFIYGRNEFGEATMAMDLNELYHYWLKNVKSK